MPISDDGRTFIHKGETYHSVSTIIRNDGPPFIVSPALATWATAVVVEAVANAKKGK